MISQTPENVLIDRFIVSPVVSVVSSAVMAVFFIDCRRHREPMKTADSLYEDTRATSRLIADILPPDFSRPSSSYIDIRTKDIGGRITTEPPRGLQRRSMISNGARPAPELQRFSQPALSSTSKRRSNESNGLYQSHPTSTVSGCSLVDCTPVPVVLKYESVRPKEPPTPTTLFHSGLSRGRRNGVLQEMDDSASADRRSGFQEGVSSCGTEKRDPPKQCGNRQSRRQSLGSKRWFTATGSNTANPEPVPFPQQTNSPSETLSRRQPTAAGWVRQTSPNRSMRQERQKCFPTIEPVRDIRRTSLGKPSTRLSTPSHKTVKSSPGRSSLLSSLGSFDCGCALQNLETRWSVRHRDLSHF